MIVGHKYRPVVTVLKVKRGVPTVIRVSGREYVFRPKDQYGNRKKGAKAREKRNFYKQVKKAGRGASS